MKLLFPEQAPLTVGVLAGWQYYWTATPLSYLDPIYRGICQAARDDGCNVLLSCGMGPSATSNDPLRPAWPVPLADEVDFVPVGPWNTDGLIVINPVHSPARSRYVQEVISAGHPVIFVGSGEAGPTIVADNETGILEAVQHLVNHGHKRIAFIAGSVEDMEGDTGERLRAYEFALRAYGLVVDPRLVAYGRHVHPGGYAAMQQILATGVPFTAVLASNDESALGVMQALKAAGLAIPRDVALIGFDDRPESAVQEPALSTVHVPLFKMGYRALELLRQRILGQGERVEKLKVPTHLVIRESCGCGRNRWLGETVPAAGTLADAGAGPTWRAQLVQTMATAVLAETQKLSPQRVAGLCEQLLQVFTVTLMEPDREAFRVALDDIFRQVAVSAEDVHSWQAAVSILRNALPQLLAATPEGVAPAREELERARLILSSTLQQQHRRYVMDQRWMIDRLGVLTARLLTALDESQIFEILAHYLPEMGVRTAGVAFYEPEGADPVAWSRMRLVTEPERAPLRFRSREFPPAGWEPGSPCFCLALLPLVNPRGLLGYVLFDTTHLELYGAIVQQLAAALHTAQLYREATEGRRLAEEANRLKSRFLSTVSHELRTPLNLIVGLCGILLQSSDESAVPFPDPYRKDVERIHTNAQQLGWLIGDVLDLASSDAGQLRLTNEWIDLGQVLRGVAEIGRQLAEDKGLDWQATLPESGPWVWGDRTRLRQVALNLITNAVKFTARGRVCLALECDAGQATVAVQDTGLGIPPEEQALVFDEFRRSERSVARGYGGLGLGLAICKRLVELHDGKIGMRSTGEEGAGSTFYFTLPIATPPDCGVGPAPAAEPAVLVVADLHSGGERLAAYLQQRGFAVQWVLPERIQEWSPRLETAPPDAVVLDMRASPGQGWELLKIIKGQAETQDIPVLFYSLAPEGGAVLELDYLTKPIEVAALTRALDQYWLTATPEPAVQTILVVDDDPHTLEMHARIVQAHSASHRVLSARDGREALEILQRETVDLVLLDLLMPELDGFGVLEAMRAQAATRSIPVIVLTGQVLTEKEMARLNRGVATVLSKGLFSVEETLAHLEAALERKRKLSSEAQRLVRQAMAYLHGHYADPLSRKEIARQVGLSEDYLTYCFRKELGMTPIAYLNRYRVNQARTLLKESGLSITEIALAVGFSDSGYFSRIFRREAGLSPEAYRRGGAT